MQRRKSFNDRHRRHLDERDSLDTLALFPDNSDLSEEYENAFTYRNVLLFPWRMVPWCQFHDICSRFLEKLTRLDLFLLSLRQDDHDAWNEGPASWRNQREVADTHLEDAFIDLAAKSYAHYDPFEPFNRNQLTYRRLRVDKDRRKFFSLVMYFYCWEFKAGFLQDLGNDQMQFDYSEWSAFRDRAATTKFIWRDEDLLASNKGGGESELKWERREVRKVVDREPTLDMALARIETAVENRMLKAEKESIKLDNLRAVLERDMWLHERPTRPTCFHFHSTEPTQTSKQPSSIYCPSEANKALSSNSQDLAGQVRQSSRSTMEVALPICPTAEEGLLLLFAEKEFPLADGSGKVLGPSSSFTRTAWSFGGRVFVGGGPLAPQGGTLAFTDSPQAMSSGSFFGRNPMDCYYVVSNSGDSVAKTRFVESDNGGSTEIWELLLPQPGTLYDLRRLLSRGRRKNSTHHSTPPPTEVSHNEHHRSHHTHIKPTNHGPKPSFAKGEFLPDTFKAIPRVAEADWAVFQREIDNFLNLAQGAAGIHLVLLSPEDLKKREDPDFQNQEVSQLERRAWQQLRTNLRKAYDRVIGDHQHQLGKATLEEDAWSSAEGSLFPFQTLLVRYWWWDSHEVWVTRDNQGNPKSFNYEAWRAFRNDFLALVQREGDWTVEEVFTYLNRAVEVHYEKYKEDTQMHEPKEEWAFLHDRKARNGESQRLNHAAHSKLFDVPEGDQGVDRPEPFGREQLDSLGAVKPVLRKKRSNLKASVLASLTQCTPVVDLMAEKERTVRPAYVRSRSDGWGGTLGACSDSDSSTGTF
ncbi:hypothetical protein T439DRAFT_373824 [Meredithblackwellia eburnea MCA 4105]